MLKRLSLIFILLLLALPMTLGAEEISITEAQVDPLSTLDAQAAKALQQLLAAESANSTSAKTVSWYEPQFGNNSCSGINRCMIDFACSEDCHSQWCSPNGCFENYCSCMQSCVIVCF